jgi:hypothetical protein
MIVQSVLAVPFSGDLDALPALEQERIVLARIKRERKRRRRAEASGGARRS